MARQDSILLTSIEDVKKFVASTNRYPFSIFLVTDRYRIDAKSIMGVFSMDLSKPVVVEAEETPQTEDFFKELEPFHPKGEKG